MTKFQLKLKTFNFFHAIVLAAFVVVVVASAAIVVKIVHDNCNNSFFLSLPWLVVVFFSRSRSSCSCCNSGRYICYLGCSLFGCVLLTRVLGPVFHCCSYWLVNRSSCLPVSVCVCVELDNVGRRRWRCIWQARFGFVQLVC